ncbi:hypothetical protein CAOG_005992 [Capsaspora owczarzaki ATCC 30864]|uniref:CUB domain-containing protein n=2 Tax=Capsaspora owczarzaki (strain ATCC 30864) TaxID=595528 RepID=A0A0D2VVM9_CAPO3|nr:hypothetical protein CAOG_005992 [Capsaspora owczarzaki ATCC 30864]
MQSAITSLVALAAFVALLSSPVQGQLSTCTASSSTALTFNGTVLSIGCAGNSVTMTWTVSTTVPLLLTFQSFQTEAGYDKVLVTASGTVYGPFSGATIPSPMITGVGNVVIQFTSDASNTYAGFTLNIATGPVVNTLVSSQPTVLTKTQQGGFVYFGLYNYLLGGSADFSVTIYSYSGLQAPGVFIARNRIPQLESYDFTNNTVQSGSDYTFRLTIPNPTDGSYYVGVFLYGTSSSLSVTGTWKFNITALGNGIKVTNTAGASPVYYQLTVPVSTASLQFQISRQVPGGYPIAVISQGTAPNANSFDYKMDTTQQSYQSLVIPSPNPSSNRNANPGNYIIAIYSATTDSAGYIFQAN